VQINWQKTLPVIISIIIILIVAVLRDKSKTLATLFATMPINMPLALWVIASGSAEDAAVLSGYVRNFIIALVPGFIWLGVVYALLKIGWGLLSAIVGGYAVWGVIIAALILLKVLDIPR
jgi:hypothetical protein